MTRTAIRVLVLGFMTAGCLPDRVTDPDLAQCIRTQVDTSDWERVTEQRGCGMGCAMRISYLVPPTFQRAGPYSWERGATLTMWYSSDAIPLDNPFPEMELTGACRSTVSNHTAFIDYGSLHGQQVIQAFWRSIPMIGTGGDILFTARMMDPADLRIVEQMIWSVEVARGGPGS